MYLGRPSSVETMLSSGFFLVVPEESEADAISRLERMDKKEVVW
jgi:hypothetical protein